MMDELMRRLNKLKEEWPEIQVYSPTQYPDKIFPALDDVFVFCQMELDNPDEKTAKVFAQEVLDLMDRHLGDSQSPTPKARKSNV